MPQVLSRRDTMRDSSGPLPSASSTSLQYSSVS